MHPTLLLLSLLLLLLLLLFRFKSGFSGEKTSIQMVVKFSSMNMVACVVIQATYSKVYCSTQ